MKQNPSDYSGGLRAEIKNLSEYPAIPETGRTGMMFDTGGDN